MLDESKTKIFGLNRVDFNKTIYITEGPIDSFYIDNAIAMAGADVDWDVFVTKKLFLCMTMNNVIKKSSIEWKKQSKKDMRL